MHVPLYRTSELRDRERVAAALLPAGCLMDRAGAATAAWIPRLAAEMAGPVVFLAGPGNNGGDALTAAAILHQQGFAVEVALLAAETSYRDDALRAWEGWQNSGGSAQRGELRLENASIVIDGLFGIGLNKPVPPLAADWINQVNQWQARTRRPVLSLDIPSGLTADTGQVLGCAVRATHTLSFLGAKPGLYTGDGPDYAGVVLLESLGIEEGGHSGFLVSPTDFSASHHVRARNSNKGQFGNLAVLAGAEGMVGAGLLCARTALYGGAGRVYLGLPGEDAPKLDWLHPEIMLRSDFAGLKLSAAVAGPGLGQPLAGRARLDQLLQDAMPLVLDADALNAVSEDAQLRSAVRGRTGLKIVTPHPLEAARLLGRAIGVVQADRVDAALELARDLQALVVLKGAGSILARPDGAWAINPTGNPGLASAGTGDVLAGLLGALLAQGWSGWDALLGGVWIHGRAADDLVAAGTGPVGLCASELMGAIRRQLNLLATTP